MQVKASRTKENGYTTYRLEAVLDGKVHAAQHTTCDQAYAALNIKDKDDLIESQLWAQLMHHIEHHLRKIAYAQTQNPDGRH